MLHALVDYEKDLASVQAFRMGIFRYLEFIHCFNFFYPHSPGAVLLWGIYSDLLLSAIPIHCTEVELTLIYCLVTFSGIPKNNWIISIDGYRCIELFAGSSTEVC